MFIYRGGCWECYGWEGGREGDHESVLSYRCMVYPPFSQGNPVASNGVQIPEEAAAEPKPAIDALVTTRRGKKQQAKRKCSGEQADGNPRAEQGAVQVSVWENVERHSSPHLYRKPSIDVYRVTRRLPERTKAAVKGAPRGGRCPRLRTRRLPILR